MGKAKRKQRPSMPNWWYYLDACVVCKNTNNCNQCKAARIDGKHDKKLARKRDKQQESRMSDED